MSKGQQHVHDTIVHGQVSDTPGQQTSTTACFHVFQCEPWSWSDKHAHLTWKHSSSGSIVAAMTTQTFERDESTWSVRAPPRHALVEAHTCNAMHHLSLVHTESMTWRLHDPNLARHETMWVISDIQSRNPRIKIAGGLPCSCIARVSRSFMPLVV